MIVATAGGFFRHLDAGKWADIGQATLDTLLMLARRPEEIEFNDLDCSALLWSIIEEMAGDGLLCLTDTAYTAPAVAGLTAPEIGRAHV